MSISSLSSLGSPPPETIPVQPDHFYGQPGPASPDTDKGYLDPIDDPLATRGIPVFKPNLEDFIDFEGYVNKVECWGMRSGIVKIIPPREWSAVLPSTVPQLAHVKLRNPIEQQMVGRGGLYRQQNMEKRRIMSVREWAELCAKDDLRAPTIEEAQGGRRYAGTIRSRPRRGRASEANVEQPKELGKSGVEDSPEDDEKPEEAGSEQNDGDMAMDDVKPDIGCEVDPASSLPTPPPSTNPSDSLPADTEASTTAAPTKRSAAERKEAKEALDAAFLTTFDPHKDWLPQGMAPEDYTPEFCRTLERIYWRNCSLGRAPWYGADMQGSLFTEATKYWNVANLPSVLSRLLGDDSKISGVNTPYLYFGMWRATFAWHVEDMDLFSINYIHFGSPKHWYAVPQARSQALETTMKGYFPRDNTTCPQFLRHKSFLASPTLLSQSSVRPNVLVQHAGEFVVTFPRGYHAGFNLGFNCAESVNFALSSWIELGLRAAFCACESDSVRIDVRGLIEAKERREREGDSTEPETNINSSRKRKVEVVIPGADNGSQPKRPKTYKAIPASPESIMQSSKSAKTTKPKLKATDADSRMSFPCCLCASMSMDGLLRVHDPPLSFSGLSKPADGVWRAHEACAIVVPETWVDEVPFENGSDGMEKVVWGVDGIVKDRWLLKCAACAGPRKTHGAPIQCTKGKCSKAFHVTCAQNGDASGVAYRVLEDIEKEVVLLEPEIAAPISHSPSTVGTVDGMNVDQIQPSTGIPTAPQSTSAATNADVQISVTHSAGIPGSTTQQPIASSSSIPTPRREGPRVLKTIKKLLVEVLCSQHNPVLIAQKKANKSEKLRNDLAALSEMSRIRIRNSMGVVEVSLVKVHHERGTVEVLWDGGQKREFRWGSIVWSSDGQTTGSKPTAEELVKLPPSAQNKTHPAAPTQPSTHTSNSSTLPPQPAPQFNPYNQSGHVPNPYRLPPDQSRAVPPHLPSYQGMSQFRVAAQSSHSTTEGASGQTSSNKYAYMTPQIPHASGSVPSPYPGYYSHSYYQQLGYAQTRTSTPSSSSVSPQPSTYLPQPFGPHNAPLSVQYSNYYGRTPYLPLTPRNISSSSSSSPAGGKAVTATGVSAAQPYYPSPLTGDGLSTTKGGAGNPPVTASPPSTVPTPRGSVLDPAPAL